MVEKGKFLEKIVGLIFAYLSIFFLLQSVFFLLKDNLQIYWWDMEQIAMICSVVSGLLLLFYWNKWSIGIGSILLLLLGSGFIFQKKELLQQEISEYVNHVLVLVNEYHQTSFFTEKEVVTESSTILLWLVAFGLGPWLAGAVLLGRKFFAGLFPIVPIFISGFFLGYSPGFSAILFLLAGVSIRYLCLFRQQEKGAKKSYLFGFLFCMLSLGMTGICYQPVADILLCYTEKVTTNHRNLGNQFLSEIQEQNVFTKIQKVLNLRENRAVLNHKKPNLTDKIVLSLTLEELPNHPIYIKDFVGVTYDQGIWYPAKEQEFEAFAKELGVEQEKLGKEIQTTVYEDYKEKVSVETAKIRLYKTNGNLSPSLYFTNLPEKVQIVGDAGIRTKQEEYSFEKLSFQEVESNLEGFYSTFSLLYFYGDEISSFYGGAVEMEEQEDAFEREKQRYNSYAQEVYTQIPYEQLPRLVETPDIAMRNLLDRCEYSFDLEPSKAGEDMVESFLFQQKKGYCMHFASAYTLLLRLQGIPARYAGGYLVLPSDFTKNLDGTYTAKVTEERAHAWTECYYEEYGWISFDATPADYQESLIQAPAGMSVEEIVKQREEENQEQEALQQQENPETSTDNAEKTKEDTEETTKDSLNSLENNLGKSEEDFRKNRVFQRIVLLLLGLVFLMTLWFLWKKYVSWKKEKIFLGTDRKKAVDGLIKEIFSLLERAGYFIEEEEMELNFAKRVEECFPCFSKGELVETVKIAMSARYGKGEITEEQREKVLQVYRKLEKVGKKDL